MATDAREIIAEALLAFVEGWSGEPDPEQGAAQAVHAALTEAGLLVEPGGETRTEWGVWYPTDTTDPRWRLGSTPDAEQAAREHMAGGYGERHNLKLVSRTVHDGPWREQP